jgi:hypothetical protein
MKCPICSNVDLVMSERQGVEIDYCPSCRGIWLDRGELDKIIDKVITAENKGSGFQPNQPEFRNQPGYQEYPRHDSPDYYKHRKKHWLSELFD